MHDMKALAVAFLYNWIKNTVSGMLPKEMNISPDLILAAVGYFKRNTWWGQGLLFGAVASLGQGFSLGSIFGQASSSGGAAAGGGGGTMTNVVRLPDGTIVHVY